MKWRNGISEQTLNRYGIVLRDENNFTDITILPQIGRQMELSMMVHWLALKLTTMLLCQSHRFSLQITNCRNCKIGLTLSLMMATIKLIISGHCGDRGRFHWLVMKNNVLNSNQKYCQACCDGNGSSRTYDHCYLSHELHKDEKSFSRYWFHQKQCIMNINQSIRLNLCCWVQSLCNEMFINIIYVSIVWK